MYCSHYINLITDNLSSIRVLSFVCRPTMCTLRRIVNCLHIFTFNPPEQPFLRFCSYPSWACFCALFTGKRIYRLRSNFLLYSIHLHEKVIGCSEHFLEWNGGRQKPFMRFERTFSHVYNSGNSYKFFLSVSSSLSCFFVNTWAISEPFQSL